MESLVVKSLFKKLKIEIQENKILVLKKSPFLYTEFEISFEELESKKKVKKEYNHGVMALALLVFCFGLIFSFVGAYHIFLVVFTISFVLFLTGLFTRRKRIEINTLTEGILEIPFESANEENVRAFADTIIRSARQYMVDKYGKVDKDLPIEGQLDNLLFLRNKEFIDEHKFEELKSKLLGRKTDEKKIGFN